MGTTHSAYGFIRLTTPTSVYPISIKSGTITMDDGWTPFTQGSIEVVATPQIQSVASAFRTQTVRVSVTPGVRQDDGATFEKTYNFVVRSVKRNRLEGTLTLGLEGDEVLLRDKTLFPSSTPSAEFYAYQDSAIAFANAALAKVGLGPVTTSPADDDPLDARPTSINMMPNPSAEVDLSNVGYGGLANVTRQGPSASAPHASYLFRLNAGTTPDSFMYEGGDGGDMRLEMRAGQTYTVSGSFYIDGPLTGTAHARARRIAVFYRVGTGPTLEVTSPQAPNVKVVGGTRVAVTFTLPDDTTEAFIRFYHGHTGGVAYWDALRLSPGDGIATNDTGYFDGSSTATPAQPFQFYGWTGTPGTSTSQRTAGHGRDADALYWSPDESLWDFVQGVLEPSGFALRCYPDRTWQLVNLERGATGDINYTTLTIGEDVLTLDDGLDLEDDSWAEAVVVTFRWTQINGVQKVATQSAKFSSVTSPRKVKLIDFDSPPRGGNYATAYLRRIRGLVSNPKVTAINDFHVAPGQVFELYEDGSFIPGLQVGSVTFNLASREMEIQSRTADPGNVIAL